MRLLIIGIDGITWNIVDPLIAQGRLPNLARLIENGARGVSTAIEPALSPIIWTSIASGKLPEKHGVTHFFDTAKSMRCRRLWDIFETSIPDGASAPTIGLFSWPVTWPPRPINGFMVPSLFARDNDTWPPELRFVKDMEGGLRTGWRERVSLVTAAMRHGLRTSTASQLAAYALAHKQGRYNELDRFIKQRTLKLNVHLDVFEHLLQAYKPDLATFYMNQTDAFSHRFWRYYEPERFNDITPKDVQRYGDVIPQAYEMADRAVGRILKHADPDTLIAVVSDHGFEATDAGADGQRFCGRARGEQVLKSLGLADQATYVNHREWVMIKLSTKANERRDEIISLLEAYRVPELNAPLLKVNQDSTGEIAILVHADTEAHLDRVELDTLSVEFASLSNGSNGSSTISRLAFLDLVQPEYDTRMSGVHEPDGIAIFNGPGVQAGTRVEQGSVLDVLPTLLALMGRPIGRDMDGKPLTQIIQPEFLAQNPLTYIDTYDTGLELKTTQTDEPASEELMSRLRALGYVN
jgi:predicted AlkP superfamily phosphohydrolase/phosphomutase